VTSSCWSTWTAWTTCRLQPARHGLWRGGSGATRAELRKACAEQYELAGLAALKPTSFTYAFTKMEEAGWLREGRSASRFILSEPGCRHLGVEYVGPMDWDEES